MIIIGAGLSGLLAGALDRSATIVEKQSSLPNNHHAVLRFRSDKIGKALNIKFRKVKVTKGVVGDDGVVRSVATPADINQYSMKTIGAMQGRSVANLDTVERYIAPPDLIQQLAEMCEGRIRYGVDFRKDIPLSGKIINTAPLHLVLDHFKIEFDKSEFNFAPIRVMKYKIPNADVFQTIYFTGKKTPLYRASITGDELLLEIAGHAAFPIYNLEYALNCFGIELTSAECVSTERQSYGKINPLPAERRQALLYMLSRDHKVYSLGRFACWRNVLMDDVFEDFYKIKSMMSLGQYEHLLKGADNES